jgi:hypothetical protein
MPNTKYNYLVIYSFSLNGKTLLLMSFLHILLEILKNRFINVKQPHPKMEYFPAIVVGTILETWKFWKLLSQPVPKTSLKAHIQGQG